MWTASVADDWSRRPQPALSLGLTTPEVFNELVIALYLFDGKVDMLRGASMRKYVSAIGVRRAK
jgi:hypothetical protein